MPQPVGSVVRPVISYINDYWEGSLYVARPLVDAPATTLDWVRCNLDSRVSRTCITTVGDRPFVIYLNTTEDAIKCAWAETASFAGPADFDIITIQQPMNSEFCSVACAAVGDVPVIAYDDDDQHQLRFGFYSE